MCTTYEDVIWAYLNEQIQNMLDKSTLETSESSIDIPKEIVELALKKDTFLEK